ncbi:unnamed protein product [Ostreobium quekettii]|uniref:Mitochondrial glycoprotein n=1 Tax=Ostreobium quekettii TaxID=121088 RepID=A0A8S1J366_9CHLO|nr:unnamed protein product [Ostreobium quekettii]
MLTLPCSLLYAVKLDYTALFNVTVTKGNESLVFECETDGDHVDILKILLETKGKSDVMTDFLGPTYEELDDDLQDSCQKYLEERGITSEMGDYLLELVLDKEQREYMDWLKKVKAFVAK